MVTILTTTYNRAYCLDRLYKSLQKQSSKEFEWIVVDDGSTDNTRELIDKWKKETKDFSICYYWTENGGKHHALNVGTEKAKGECVVNVDSDDYLLQDAVEFVHDKFKEIEDDEKFAGIAGLKCFSDGSIIGGKPIFDQYVDANSYDFDFHIQKGDKAEAYKTAVLKKYPFPEFKGENFMSEGAVFFKIAYDGYLVRWYNKPLVCCEYLSDGLTKNAYRLYKKNPKGWAEYIKSRNLFGEELPVKYKHRFWYLMKNCFERNELSTLLGITVSESYDYDRSHYRLLSELESLCTLNHISSVTVYGCGTNALLFSDYLEQIGKRIEFGIDREKNSSFEKVYTITDFPNVDAVFVTPSNLSSSVKEEVRRRVKERWNNCIVYYLDELFPDFF